MLTEKAKKAVHEVAVAGCFVLAFSCAVEAEIPSASECKVARAKLAELTSDDYKALKAKTKTNEQVGDALLGYADNEESAAGKFALLQDAFKQYVLGKSVDKAESVYSKAQTIGGMEYALEMARPSRSKLSAYATSKNALAKALMDRIEKDEKSVSDEKDQTEKRRSRYSRGKGSCAAGGFFITIYLLWRYTRKKNDCKDGKGGMERRSKQ